MTNYENINLPNSQCEASNEYNFGECVEASLISKAGCQSYWSRFNLDLPLCDNDSLMEKNSYEYWAAMHLGKNELINQTECLMPCTFMEYKVTTFTNLNLQMLHSLNSFLCKIAGGRPHKNGYKWLDLAVAHVCQ